MLRKVSIWVLCIVMLLSLTLPFAVQAEGELEISGVSVNTDGSTWVVTWGSNDEESRLLSVQLSGASGGDAMLTVLSNSVGYAEVDGSAAPYGTSSIDLAFGTGAGVETCYASGGTYTNSAQIQMTVTVKSTDGTVAIQVTDSNGNAVARAPITVNVGGSAGALSNQTDDYGYASFDPAGISGGLTWEFIAEDFDTGDGVSYLSGSATATVGETATTPRRTTTRKREVRTTEAPVVTEPLQDDYSEPEQSEEESEPEESEEESEPRETSPQLPTLPEDETGDVSDVPYEATRGATTTHASETEVACNLSVDKSLLSLMKLKINAFNKVGRLIVSKENYADLVELYGGTMTGSLVVSPYEAVTTEQIKTSMQSESAFSESTPEKAIAITFGLALDFVQEGGSEPIHVTDLSEVDGEWMFDVQIPVPGNMKKCKSFGVAMTGDKTLTPLTQVKAKDGIISFRTPVLGYYTLVGFTDGKSASEGASPLKVLFIVLIIVGVLMLGGCGFLTYWFFFRKKGKGHDDDDDDDFINPDDNAYYEEKTPDDEQEHEDAAAFMHDIMGGAAAESVDIYSSSEREAEALDPIMSPRREVERGGDDIFGLYSRRIDE